MLMKMLMLLLLVLLLLLMLVLVMAQKKTRSTYITSPYTFIYKSTTYTNFPRGHHPDVGKRPIWALHCTAIAPSCRAVGGRT